LREACQQAIWWLDRGLEIQRIAVNISTKEFECIGFLENVRGVLQDIDLMPHYLEQELTERCLRKILRPILKEPDAMIYSNEQTEKKIQASEFVIGFNHFLKAPKVIPVDQLSIPNRPGCIGIYQEIDEQNVRTWHLEVMIRRSNKVCRFAGVFIEI
jgi:predicted signal transduction protein with EAL and GGDEF domain